MTNTVIFGTQLCNRLFVFLTRRTNLPKCHTYLVKAWSRTARCPLQIVQFVHQIDKTLLFGIQFLFYRIGLFDKLILCIARFNCVYFGGQVIVWIFQILNHLALNLDTLDHFLCGLIHHIATSGNGIRKALHTPQCFVNSRIKLTIV